MRLPLGGRWVITRQMKPFSVKLPLCSSFAALLLVLSLGVSSCFRGATETQLATFDASTWIPATFTVSPDKQHVAFAVQTDNQQSLLVDGQMGGPFDRIDCV